MPRDVFAAKERWVIMVEEEAKGAAVRERDSQVFDLKEAVPVLQIVREDV